MRRIPLFPLLVFAGSLPAAADEFESRLVEHRVRSGQVFVDGVLNAAYGPGLLDPARPVHVPFSMSQPPIHTVNLVARQNAPLEVQIDPRQPAPVNLFGITHTAPAGSTASGFIGFGSVTVPSSIVQTSIYRDVQVCDIHESWSPRPTPQKGSVNAAAPRGFETAGAPAPFSRIALRARNTH